MGTKKNVQCMQESTPCPLCGLMCPCWEPTICVECPSPLLEFPGEQGMFTDMYAQVREEEQVISLQFTCSQQDASMRRRKKRKQVDDDTASASDYFLLKTLGEPGIVVCVRA